MNILYQTYHYFSQKIASGCLGTWKKRLSFGFECLSIKPLESLNGNAREIIPNRKTAESKIYRLVHTEYFLSFFPELLSKLSLVQRGDIINVDFSDFHGRQVLMFAKQTHEGRAIPLYFEFLKYPIEEGSQNIFILEAIQQFLKYVKVPVHFVFDRGFAVPEMISELAWGNIPFTIRIKKDKKVDFQDCRKAVKNFRSRDRIVQIYDHSLRIVRSKRNAAQYDEPWFLVTNDFQSETEEIIERYYHRFEIEEYFWDKKHLSKLEYLWKVSDRTFSIVMWFLILGSWIVWSVKSIRKAWQQTREKLPAHHALSLPRFWFEALHREQYLLFKSAFFQRFS